MARPSAMAVLPTPGSPMRQGLFFWRRFRIWITRSNSWSRPIILSSLPSAALRVREMQWFSRNLRLVRALRSGFSARPWALSLPPWGAEGAGVSSFFSSWPFMLPMRRLRKGKVAVRPSSSSSSSSRSPATSRRDSVMLPIRSCMLSVPSKADIISLVRPSSSSSLRPIFSIISVTGRMFSSRAHFKQRPSLWLFWPLGSRRVIKTTATFFLHLLQRVGFIGCGHSFVGCLFFSIV